MAARAFHAEEKKVGLPLADLAEETRGVRMSFDDLRRQPRRLLNSPCWTGIVDAGAPYTAYALNVERLVPWRTAHRAPAPLPRPPGLPRARRGAADLQAEARPGAASRTSSRRRSTAATLRLNFLTPHGKWSIHSTYGDNLRMLTLSRGLHPLWVSDAGRRDARHRATTTGSRW